MHVEYKKLYGGIEAMKYSGAEKLQGLREEKQ
jgi:hypothetical protein